MYTWLSQRCGETLVMWGGPATLHDEIRKEVAGNADHPTHLMARGLRPHLGERDRR